MKRRRRALASLCQQTIRPESPNEAQILDAEGCSGTHFPLPVFAGVGEKDLSSDPVGRSQPRGSLMSPAKTVKKAKQPSLAEFEIKIGPPKLTRFERARIVGARSLQIAMGAPAFVPMEGQYRGPIQTAMMELEADALPISIRRSLPNGITQDIPIRALAK